LIDQKILQMDAMVELRRTAEGQSSVYFQQIQYLEKSVTAPSLGTNI